MNGQKWNIMSAFNFFHMYLPFFPKKKIYLCPNINNTYCVCQQEKKHKNHDEIVTEKKKHKFNTKYNEEKRALPAVHR